MPASYTHYRFGQDILNRNNNTLINDIIIHHQDIFNIGLHGPDILFYYKPYTRCKVNQIGHSLHAKKASVFFKNAKKILDNPNNNESLAYLLGFICHFSLDSHCHPFVDKIIMETKVTHFEIESEYDQYLMKQDHLNPLRHPLTNHISNLAHINKVIAPFFDLPEIAIEKSIKGMKFYDRLFLAPNLLKRGLIYTAMIGTFTYRPLQGLIVNYKANEKVLPYFKEMDSHYQKALLKANFLMSNFIDYINGINDLDNWFDKNYK